MGAQPGDDIETQTFTLPSHVNEGLTTKQSAERIADYFSGISQEFLPLDSNNLPDRVKQRLGTKSPPPNISEFECYQKIVASKKPRSGVPGDIPGQILKEFAVELAQPLHNILNEIVLSSP